VQKKVFVFLHSFDRKYPAVKWLLVHSDHEKLQFKAPDTRNRMPLFPRLASRRGFFTKITLLLNRDIEGS